MSYSQSIQSEDYNESCSETGLFRCSLISPQLQHARFLLNHRAHFQHPVALQCCFSHHVASFYSESSGSELTGRPPLP